MKRGEWGHTVESLQIPNPARRQLALPNGDRRIEVTQETRDGIAWNFPNSEESQNVINTKSTNSQTEFLNLDQGVIECPRREDKYEDTRGSIWPFDPDAFSTTGSCPSPSPPTRTLGIPSFVHRQLVTISIYPHHTLLLTPSRALLTPSYTYKMHREEHQSTCAS